MSADLADLMLFVAVIVGAPTVALAGLTIGRVFRHRRAIDRRIEAIRAEIHGGHFR